MNKNAVALSDKVSRCYLGQKEIVQIIPRFFGVAGMNKNAVAQSDKVDPLMLTVAKSSLKVLANSY